MSDHVEESAFALDDLRMAMEVAAPSPWGEALVAQLESAQVGRRFAMEGCRIVKFRVGNHAAALPDGMSWRIDGSVIYDGQEVRATLVVTDGLVDALLLQAEGTGGDPDVKASTTRARLWMGASPVWTLLALAVCIAGLLSAQLIGLAAAVVVPLAIIAMVAAATRWEWGLLRGWMLRDVLRERGYSWVKHADATRLYNRIGGAAFHIPHRDHAAQLPDFDDTVEGLARISSCLPLRLGGNVRDEFSHD